MGSAIKSAGGNGIDMIYTINDKNLITEICKFKSIIDEEKSVLVNLGCTQFVHPLDNDILGEEGLLQHLLMDSNGLFLYSTAKDLDDLWKTLLDKSIRCLRFFDKREPFQNNSQNAIIAYGINDLDDYQKKYTEFESLMYGANTYYRHHVFHAIRVWMLGVFCLIHKEKGVPCLYSQLYYDGLEHDTSNNLNFFECISMWTVAALCHDLGYPLEKTENILESTRKMMKEFIPNLSICNSFGNSGTQDNINEYILKFISTKMIEKAKDDDGNPLYYGRIQPKYYLKYAKSLENYKHGIISAVIVFKMLLYFVESDFNLNDDYTFKVEDARQFYIRREILRAMTSHTCPDAYNIHMYTFPSLLFLCDELQKWGRKTWNELYVGLKDNPVELTINHFKKDNIEITEKINMTNTEDVEMLLNNICCIFEQQYSLYKTKFRAGQDTVKRDFDITKKMILNLETRGSTENIIEIIYSLPKDSEGLFKVDLTKYRCTDKGSFKDKLKNSLIYSLYCDSLKVITSEESCR